jgi:hypothetical protein
MEISAARSSLFRFAAARAEFRVLDSSLCSSAPNAYSDSIGRLFLGIADAIWFIALAAVSRPCRRGGGISPHGLGLLLVALRHPLRPLLLALP